MAAVWIDSGGMEVLQRPGGSDQNGSCEDGEMEKSGHFFFFFWRGGIIKRTWERLNVNGNRE